MVKALEYLSETTLAKLISDLKPIANMLAFFCDVLILVIIKSVVLDSVRSRWRPFLVFPFLNIEPVDDFVVEDLALLVVHEVLREVDNHCSWVYWELKVPLMIIQGAVCSLLSDV